MRAIEALLRYKLPPQFHDSLGDMSGKAFEQLLVRVAKESPDQYPEILKTLSDVGRNSAYLEGETLGIDDFDPVVDRETAFAQMDAELAAAKQNAASEEEYKTLRNMIWIKYADQLEQQTLEQGTARLNNIALSVKSGARGKADQLKAMITTPGLYADAKDDLVPIFIRNSFADGLRPAEYLAGTFGARKAVVAIKTATAKGGDANKQANAAAAHLVVSQEDCGTDNGILLDLDDDVRGRILSQPVGDFPAGTPVDRAVLATLRKQKRKSIPVRSTLSCQAKNGICAHCYGLEATGKFPQIGDAIGMTNAQSIFEPITQGTLRAKHSGGQAKGSKRFAGFKYINQLLQSPEVFEDKAPLSEVGGTVSEVREAPQGGFVVKIEDQEHYVLPGQQVLVKVGDKLEQGQPLSDGLVDTADVVRLRGLGEGRLYLAKRLKQVLDDSGHKATPRQTELQARAVLDHVEIEDWDEDSDMDALPGEIISYERAAQRFVPSATARQLHPSDESIRGKFLAGNYLHYTVGTPVTDSIRTQLMELNKPVTVQDEPPPFKPSVVRMRAGTFNTDDWMARLSTSNLGRGLQEAALAGDDTNVLENTHFAARLAYGKDFGKNIRKTGKF